MQRIKELGLDVGSMTVKATVFTAGKQGILWQDYRRHNGRQAECVGEVLRAITGAFPGAALRIAITGSGGRALSQVLGARFIQEVNAVTLAVETLIPGAGSVVELGGQDAKVIIWKGSTAPAGIGANEKTTLTYMNDKCAGGTGATIDKIIAKIGLSPEEAAQVDPAGREVHRIAAKCGVFAETDVVGLLKAGVNREDIFVSLCHAIVKQNLEVLVHGNALPETVVLLGGPNTFIPAFAPIWREHISEAWNIHGYKPREAGLERSVIVPPDSQFFAAMGAVFFARESGEAEAVEPDLAALEGYIRLNNADVQGTKSSGDETDETLVKLPAKLRGDAHGEGSILPPLAKSAEEIEAFRRDYAVPDFVSPDWVEGTLLNVYIGVDGGSTSTKITLVDEAGKPVYRDYILSQGNPLEDARLLFSHLRAFRDSRKLDIKILGTAATGYAQEILKAGLGLDMAVVETVAHMRSATALYGDVDVICDVGGQDIKVLFMKNRRVVDFKLNTQCSAGNGYFLQSMAAQAGIPVEEYADCAFQATRAPRFNYGCAVFMEQDRVNFQQAGWLKEEMMSGLAQVLPLNIWNYVVQESNLASLGKRFVLQGGTQKNLAAVKAQVDHIKRKVPGAEVHVHRYADLGGAIGAALEARDRAQASAFIGIDAAATLHYSTRNDETTRCSGCANTCRRTFVDIATGGSEGDKPRTVRFISGYLCERGASEDPRAASVKARDKRGEEADLSALAADWAFSDFDFAPIPDGGGRADRAGFYPASSEMWMDKKAWRAPFERSSAEAAQRRAAMTVGIPRLLNMFYYTPLFSTYLRCLGLKVVYSGFSDDRLWSEGNKWGAIDPCFPAKVAPAHIWQLLNIEGLNAICFPIITHLETMLEHTLGNAACAIQMGTPEVAQAAFTRNRDLLREKSVDWWDPSIKMDRAIEACDCLYQYFGERLGISRDENAWAFRQGEEALKEYLRRQREFFVRTMNGLIDNDKVGLLLIGHPYHHDPGLNHGIPEAFRKRGYPIFTIESLPPDEAFLGPLFPEGLERDISAVWMRNFNRSTNHKIWAARIASRHPNLAVIDLSSFKCGHDAPTYSYVDTMLDVSQTPHFTFHDIDQNRPGASFKIRIDTIDYFLKEYERNLKQKAALQKK